MTQEIGNNSLINTWAASGTKEQPSLSKYNNGWDAGERPPHEFFNYLLNEVGKQINYMLRTGIPEWNAATPYVAQNAVQYGGEVYVAITGNTNSAPSATSTQWSRLPKASELPTYVPPGALMPFARATAPTGWLKCNGQAVSRTTYANLFAAIGTTFGTGNGSTTFNVPDLRGEFLRGLDDGRGIDTGRAIGTSQSDQNKQHNHGITDPGHAHSINDPGHAHSQITCVDAGSGGVPAGTTKPYYIPGSGSTGASGTGVTVSGAATGISINNSGGNEARPRNIAALYCIKY